MVRFLAYVDPGTGSFAIQAVIGTIMGVSFAARNRIKMLVGKFQKKPQSAPSTPEAPAPKPEKS